MSEMKIFEKWAECSTSSPIPSSTRSRTRSTTSSRPRSWATWPHHSSTSVWSSTSAQSPCSSSVSSVAVRTVARGSSSPQSCGDGTVDAFGVSRGDGRIHLLVDALVPDGDSHAPPQSLRSSLATRGRTSRAGPLSRIPWPASRRSRCLRARRGFRPSCSDPPPARAGCCRRAGRGGCGARGTDRRADVGLLDRHVPRVGDDTEPRRADLVHVPARVGEGVDDEVLESVERLEEHLRAHTTRRERRDLLQRLAQQPARLLVACAAA